MNKNTKNKAGKEHNQQAQVAESSTPSCQFQNEGDPGLQEGDSDMDWVAEFEEPEEINGNLRPSGSGEWYRMVEDRDGVIRPGGTGEA